MDYKDEALRSIAGMLQILVYGQIALVVLLGYIATRLPA